MITVTSQNVAWRAVLRTGSTSVIAFVVLALRTNCQVNISTQTSSTVEELLGRIGVADAWVTFLIERVSALVTLTRKIHAASAVLDTRWTIIPTKVVLTSWAFSEVHALSSVVIGANVEELGDQTSAVCLCLWVNGEGVSALSAESGYVLALQTVWRTVETVVLSIIVVVSWALDHADTFVVFQECLWGAVGDTSCSIDQNSWVHCLVTETSKGIAWGTQNLIRIICYWWAWLAVELAWSRAVVVASRAGVNLEAGVFQRRKSEACWASALALGNILEYWLASRADGAVSSINNAESHVDALQTLASERGAAGAKGFARSTRVICLSKWTFWAHDVVNTLAINDRLSRWAGAGSSAEDEARSALSAECCVSCSYLSNLVNSAAIAELRTVLTLSSIECLVRLALNTIAISIDIGGGGVGGLHALACGGRRVC